jgi:hypothetical protein
VLDGRIHLARGRMDTFDFNTGMHVACDSTADTWQECAPMATPRSGWKAYAQMTAPRHGMA